MVRPIKRNVAGVFGADLYLKKLNALKDAESTVVPRVIAKTTLLGHREIVKIITNEIEPHKAKRRGKVGVFTDLVDTGFYRQGWQTDVSTPGVGKLFTNVAYSPILEFGFDGVVDVREHTRRLPTKAVKVKGHKRKMKRRAYYVLRRTKARMRSLLIKIARDELERVTNG